MIKTRCAPDFIGDMAGFLLGSREMLRGKGERGKPAQSAFGAGLGRCGQCRDAAWRMVCGGESLTRPMGHRGPRKLVLFGRGLAGPLPVVFSCFHLPSIDPVAEDPRAESAN